MGKLFIDSNTCIGCDLCVELCPDLFKSTDFVPTPSDKDVTNISCAKDAVAFCPTNAIRIE